MVTVTVLLTEVDKVRHGESYYLLKYDDRGRSVEQEHACCDVMARKVELSLVVFVSYMLYVYR